MGMGWGISKRDMKRSLTTFQTEEWLSKMERSDVDWRWPCREFKQNSMRGKSWSWGFKSLLGHLINPGP